MPTDHLHTTTDTGLAAFLQVRNHLLIRHQLDASGTRVEFLFQHSPELQDDIDAYYTNNATARVSALHVAKPIPPSIQPSFLSS